MKYFSTRGDPRELSFEDAVLTGLAPDGGLYIPSTIPQLPAGWETEWANYTFQELSLAVLSLYIDPSEISKEELKQLIDKSYSTFRHPDVVPLQKINDHLYVLELFHGPTFAFKDVALQLLGNLFEFFLQRKNQNKKAGEARENLTVVGATSGDTGSAAIYGLRNKTDISIFILHPKGRVSPIQEAQMTTVLDENVHNIAVKGTFDDCQDIVKSLFADKDFNAKHHLGAINSINWARILAQTVYYFLSYFYISRQLRSSQSSSASFAVQYVVPTGNFGDILAGYYAKKMGLPMDKLVAATNENDILARFWKSGRYEKVESEATPNGHPPTPPVIAPAAGSSDGQQATQAHGVKETHSPAMDILVSSNFERLLWYLAGAAVPPEDKATARTKACDIVRDWMTKVKQDGRVEVPTAVLDLAREDFVAERIDDELTIKTIQHFYDAQPSYIADPHTAVGLAASHIVASNAPSSRPAPIQISLSTAHPAKFSSAVSLALSSRPSFSFESSVLPPEFRGLLEKERRVIDVERPEVELVKDVIERVASKGSSTAGAELSGSSV